MSQWQADEDLYNEEKREKYCTGSEPFYIDKSDVKLD